MPEIKQDNGTTVAMLAAIFFGSIAGLVCFCVWGVAGSVCALGLMLGFGAVVIIRLVYFYRCPSCKRRLDTEPSTLDDKDTIRHHCPHCSVIWDSGVMLRRARLVMAFD